MKRRRKGILLEKVKKDLEKWIVSKKGKFADTIEKSEKYLVILDSIYNPCIPNNPIN
jgi:hypothetical protein